jgi:hypothetical protein
MEEGKQGGLTGATGSLTPSDPDEEFVPAETREINDPSATRPMEPAGDGEPAPPGDPVLGGDERRDSKDEHL